MSDNEFLMLAAEIGDETPTIDLHGYSSEDVHEAVEKAIDRAYMSKVRVIKILHGRGKQILREKVLQALKEIKENPSNLIETYAPATQKSHEYNAAVYVVVAKKSESYG